MNGKAEKSRHSPKTAVTALSVLLLFLGLALLPITPVGANTGELALVQVVNEGTSGQSTGATSDNSTSGGATRSWSDNPATSDSSTSGGATRSWSDNPVTTPAVPPAAGGQSGGPTSGQSGGPGAAGSNTASDHPIVPIQNPLNVESVGAAVNVAAQIFTYIVILIAVIMFIWIGLQFILARGNTQRLKELKNWLTYLVIGVAVVIGARIIIQIVINTLDSTGLVNEQVIQSANKAVNGR